MALELGGGRCIVEKVEELTAPYSLGGLARLVKVVGPAKTMNSPHRPGPMK